MVYLASTHTPTKPLRPTHLPPIPVGSDRITQRVAADTDRFDQPRQFQGAQLLCKVSTDDTAGALCVFDALRSGKGGPSLHIHHAQDEWIQVVAGTFDIQVGTEVFHLAAGDSVLAPKGVPHAFAQTSDGPARLLTIYQPAGTMEAFFTEASQLAHQTEEEIERLALAHGMQIVGPPLGVG